MKTKNKIIIAIFSFFGLVAISLISIIAYAYYSTLVRVYTKDGDQVVNWGMQLSLLFDRLDETKVDDGSDIGIITYTTEQATNERVSVNAYYDSNAVWGSQSNPYVISDIRHLQNLSILQDIGYFYNKYISNAGTDSTKIPYFLICNNDGTPVTIDGNDISILPIGTNEFPFIGRIGGAFKEGSTQIGDKTSDVSTIYNLTVNTTDDYIDIGLFGTIGYLGDESNGTFNGVSSTIRNILLYDVCVEVNKPTLTQLLSSFFNFHKWTYSDLDINLASQVNHENHHIGILFGHASYSTIEFISVYYSSSNKVAINIDHEAFNYASDVEDASKPNKNPSYFSTALIVGYVYNLNPDIKGDTISAGSGTSSEDISISGALGSGGGALSGLGRGYMVASNVYDKFNYISEGTRIEDTHKTIFLQDAVNENGESLAIEYIRSNIFGSVNTGAYYFHDGVFTFAMTDMNDSDKSSIEDTWRGYVVIDDIKCYLNTNYTITYKENSYDVLTSDDKQYIEYNNNRYDLVYDDVDTFFVGEDNDASWEQDNAKGNTFSIAYMKPVEGLEALDSAIKDGKELFILAKNSDGSVFLMNLSEKSQDSGFGQMNNRYFTSGMKKNFLTSVEEEQIINALKNEKINPIDNYSSSTMIEQLENDKLLALNLGTSSDLSLLKNKFQISTTKSNNNYIFKYSKGNYSMNIVYRNFLGNYYNIYCGPDDDISNQFSWNDGYRSHSNLASLSYKGENVFSVSFSINGQTRYVTYQTLIPMIRDLQEQILITTRVIFISTL